MWRYALRCILVSTFYYCTICSSNTASMCASNIFWCFNHLLLVAWVCCNALPLILLALVWYWYWYCLWYRLVAFTSSPGRLLLQCSAFDIDWFGLILISILPLILIGCINQHTTSVKATCTSNIFGSNRRLHRLLVACSAFDIDCLHLYQLHTLLVSCYKALPLILIGCINQPLLPPNHCHPLPLLILNSFANLILWLRLYLLWHKFDFANLMNGRCISIEKWWTNQSVINMFISRWGFLMRRKELRE